MLKIQWVPWISAMLLLCGSGAAGDRQRWDVVQCNTLCSRDKIIECIWQCMTKQPVSNTESLLQNQQQSNEEDDDEEEEVNGTTSLGILLSALIPSDSSDEQVPSRRPHRSEERPSYSMEHFRWGKPVNRKRRPVRVHAAIFDDDEGHEPFTETPLPSLIMRRQLESSDEQKKKNSDTKSNTKYQITHFRWGAPPADKRYGGFMRPWFERSNKPLLTLFRNIITKNAQ